LSACMICRHPTREAGKACPDIHARVGTPCQAAAGGRKTGWVGKGGLFGPKGGGSGGLHAGGLGCLSSSRFLIAGSLLHYSGHMQKGQARVYRGSSGSFLDRPGDISGLAFGKAHEEGRPLFFSVIFEIKFGTNRLHDHLHRLFDLELPESPMARPSNRPRH